MHNLRIITRISFNVIIVCIFFFFPLSKAHEHDLNITVNKYIFIQHISKLRSKIAFILLSCSEQNNSYFELSDVRKGTFYQHHILFLHFIIQFFLGLSMLSSCDSLKLMRQSCIYFSLFFSPFISVFNS